MKILMMTNTYAPMVGGIEQSIHSFTAEFERLGHEVFIVAPVCAGMPLDEVGVIRLRAIQKFNKSDFSIALPMSNLLPELMKTFAPDIIHCHHPFWMGDIAVRLSSEYHIPLIFTYHTMFEQHMHYLPVQNEATKRFILDLFTGYANMVTQVIVPSESVRVILKERGVTTPIEVVPTGVDLKKFAKGDWKSIRERFGIPQKAVIIGYIGRLAIEKNLEFLARSVAQYLKKNVKAHFLVGGNGPLKEMIEKIFEEQGARDRLHLVGVLKGQDLVDCYHAMDIFAFASLSETQGIVLVEAMAAGVPVVAMDAPGVREVVKNGYNGRLVFVDNKNNFTAALSWCLKRSSQEIEQMKINAKATTKEFAIDLCAAKMIKVYKNVSRHEHAWSESKITAWVSLSDKLKSEWGMFKNMMHAGGAAMDPESSEVPVIRKTEGKFLDLPRLLSLREWSAR